MRLTSFIFYRGRVQIKINNTASHAKVTWKYVLVDDCKAAEDEVEAMEWSYIDSEDVMEEMEWSDIEL
jgi:hypothetical protein